MRKLFTLFLGLIFLANGSLSAKNKIITLDLKNPTNPSSFVVDKEKGYWVETYNTAQKYRWIDFGVYTFSHTLSGFGGTEVGGGMSYWDGFTYCTSGDPTDYGVSGSSDGWVPQQWGCMAGGGIKTDADGKVITDAGGKVVAEKGIPYLVAYWGYWNEEKEGGDPCLQVKFTDGEEYEAVGIYICNHPWPYYGNIHGDGFASPFTEEGQYFKLIIHGLNQHGEDIGVTVEHMLAEFKNGKLHQSPDWQYVDLSGLGTVSGIYFTMETSDADPIYGPNTAVYFCMDKLQVGVREESTVPTRPTGLSAAPTETTIDFSWNASDGIAGIKGYNLYLDGILKAFVQSTQYTFTDLSPYTAYQIGIEAVSKDDLSSEKAFISVTTTDNTVPTMPENLSGTTTPFTMSLSWNASSDNVGVTEYHIYLNGERQKRVYTTSVTLTGLDPATEYLVEVEARDAFGNRSEKANLTLTTLDNPTSIDPAAVGQGRVSVYTNHIRIETSKAIRIELYGLNGTKMINQIVSAGNNTIDISHLPHSVYILRYGDQIKKIIK